MLLVSTGMEQYLGADAENETKNDRRYTKQTTPHSKARSFVKDRLCFSCLLQLSQVPAEALNGLSSPNRIRCLSNNLLLLALIL